MSRISLVMVTLDESRMLEPALRSAALLADELLVADMGSSDGSQEIAASLGAQVVSIPRAPVVELVRPGLIDQTTGEWVLVLDPDEVISPALAARLRQVVERDEADVVEIARSNHLMGREIRGCRFGPAHERHVRFFRRGAAELPAQVHATISPVEGARLLCIDPDDGLVHHYAYVSWEQWIEKMNRYTTMEAADLLARGERPTLRRMLKAVAGELYYRGLRDRCWRDGWRGLCLVALMAAYQVSVFAKARLRSEGSGEDVGAIDRASAEDVLGRAKPR